MTQPASAIEFWFDFSSPYAYFAAAAVDAVAARHGRAVTWRPFLLRAVFEVTGMTLLSKTPLRGDYARHDWARLARRAGVAFRPPAQHPVMQSAASRAYYWIEETKPGHAAAFAAQVFHAYFAQGRDTSEGETVADIAAACGIEREETLNAIAAAASKEKVRAMTQEAIGRGIFGSPFFIADGEPFWGHDRLEMMDAWLALGGW